MNTLLPPKPLAPTAGGRQSPQRLVVLVPNPDVDLVKFSWAIRQLAAPNKLDVLLVSAVSEVEAELAARRSLVTICSLVNEMKYGVDFKVVWDHSWIHAIAGLAQPGDLFICPPEITIRTGLRKHEPLDIVLTRKLNVQTRPLPHFFANPGRGLPFFLLRIVYWLVILAILGGFFVLESDAAQAASGFISQTIIIFLMALELGAIYLWTTITG